MGGYPGMVGTRGGGGVYTACPSCTVPSLGLVLAVPVPIPGLALGSLAGYTGLVLGSPGWVHWPGPGRLWTQSGPG